MLKPAKPGTGIVAGSGVRAILEVSGIKNIITKSLGSNSSVNLCKATINGLEQIKDIMKSISVRNMQKEEALKNEDNPELEGTLTEPVKGEVKENEQDEDDIKSEALKEWDQPEEGSQEDA